MKKLWILLLVALAAIACIGLVACKDKGGQPSGSQQEEAFVLNLETAPTLVSLPTLDTEGSCTVYGSQGGENVGLTLPLPKLSNELYYSATPEAATCEVDSGRRFNPIAAAFVAEIKRVYLTDDDQSAQYFNIFLKPWLENLFAVGEEHDALGHDYLLPPVLVRSATATQSGEIRFNCSRCDGYLRYTLPVLGSDVYETTSKPATCSAKASVNYVLLPIHIVEFLDEHPELYADVATKNLLVDALVRLSVQNVQDPSGSYDPNNHEGELSFNKSSVPSFELQNTDEGLIMAEIPATKEVTCRACQSLVGTSDPIGAADGYWVEVEGGWQRMYTVTFEGIEYEVESPNEFRDDNWTIALYIGEGATIASDASFGKTNHVSIYGNSGTDGLIVILSKITKGDLNARDNATIRVYVHGVPIDYPTLSSAPDADQSIYRRGAGLYIKVGDYDPNYFPGDVLVLIDWDEDSDE